MQNKKEFLDLVELCNDNVDSLSLHNSTSYNDFNKKIEIANKQINILEQNIDLLINEIKDKIDLLILEIQNDIMVLNRKNIISIIIKLYLKKETEKKINNLIKLKIDYLYCINNKNKEIENLKNKIKIINKNNKY